MTELCNTTTDPVSHTSGPWKIDWTIAGGGRNEDFPELHYANIYSHGYMNSAPAGLSITGYIRKADALLIAAAPELLEALKELLASQLAVMPPFEAGAAAQDAWSDRRAKARNDAAWAVAKATGEHS